MSNSAFSKIKMCLGTATVAVALVAGASALSYYGFANPNTFFIGEDKMSNILDGSLAVSLNDPEDEEVSEEVAENDTASEEPQESVINGATFDRDERIKKAKEEYPSLNEREAELVQTMKANGGIDDAPVFDISYTLPEKFFVGLKESMTSIIPSEPVLNVATSASKGGQAISSTAQLFAFSKTTGILRMYGTLAEIKASGSGTQFGNGWQDFTSIHNADWDGDGVPDIVGFKGKDIYVYKGIKGKINFQAPVHVNSVLEGRPIVSKVRASDKWPGVTVLRENGQILSYGRKDSTSLDQGFYVARNIPANSQIMGTQTSTGAADFIIRPKSGRFEFFKTQNNDFYITQVGDFTGSDQGSSSNRQAMIDGFAGSGTRGIIEVVHSESPNNPGTLYYRPMNVDGVIGAKEKIGTEGWAAMVLSNGSYKNNP